MEAIEVKRRGLMLVLSSPSGAGKTTISRRLMARDPNLIMSVSVTTRPRRRGEVSGVDYNFIDKTAFRELVERGKLLEHAKVFDHYYGTPRAPVEKALGAGLDVLFDIDWQGTSSCARTRAAISSACSFCRPAPRNWSVVSNPARKTAPKSLHPACRRRLTR